ncbi:RuBisCO large subunit-binding protein subunit beta, chloroplastic [Tanacetum coccineum]
MRQASSKTNDLNGDVTTRLVAASAKPVQITRGIEITTKAFVAELKWMSTDVKDNELTDVAAVSAANNPEVGNMIVEVMSKVGRQGIVTIEEGKSAKNSMYVVEGMQSNRGNLSPYFVINSGKMTF